MAPIDKSKTKKQMYNVKGKIVESFEDTKSAIQGVDVKRIVPHKQKNVKKDNRKIKEKEKEKEKPMKLGDELENSLNLYNIAFEEMKDRGFRLLLERQRS